MSMRQQTKSKYTECINECYTVRRFIQEEMRNKYLLDNNLFVAMHQCNVIRTINGISRWTDVVLTDQIINNILSVYSNHRKTKNFKRKEKRKLSRLLPEQLTIKQIRKVPADAPKPVVQEAECDTNNSKMFLILAVGAVVGFMIATIIWK